MSFLDGVLKPGQGAELAVRRELELRRKQWTRPGYHYRGIGDFLLQHGTFWTGRQLPDKYAHLMGRPGTCYESALAAVEADPTLRYCEGVYSNVGDDFKGHAWCIDPNDEIVEVTQPTDPETISRAVTTEGLPFLPVERWGYFGCVINADYVRDYREKMPDNGLAIFDLSAVEEQRQWTTFGSPPTSPVGWGDEDIEDEDDTDWDEDDDPEPYTQPREWPILRQPFDPNRTAL